MTEDDFPYQPGAILHDAIIGAFRSSGTSFGNWCRDRGMSPNNARNATYGIAKGPEGQKLLIELIQAAGPDVVRAGYVAAIRRYNAVLKEHGVL